MTPFREVLSSTERASKVHSHLLSFIYDPMEKCYDKKILELGHRNASLCFSDSPIFMYKGTYFNIPKHEKVPYSVPLLEKELRPELDALLYDKNNTFIYEKSRVATFISGCLNRTTDTNTFLTMLPESLQQPALELFSPTDTFKPVRLGSLQADYVEQNKEIRDSINQRCTLNILL